MLYSRRMKKKFQGYEMTEEDIQAILRYLKTNVNKDATREDAIKFLEENNESAHLIAHKLVEDEKSGKIEHIDLKKLNKK